MGETRQLTESSESFSLVSADGPDETTSWAPERALRRPIFVKLALAIATISLVPLLFTIHRSSTRAEEALRAEARARLTAVAQSKADRVETYANEQRHVVSILAQSLDVITAFDRLPAVEAAADEAERPTTADELAPALAPAPATELAGGSIADSVADRVDDVGALMTPLRHYVEYKEYSNLFLVSVDGEVLVSVDPHACTGTNLNTGPCREQPIAAVYNGAKTLLHTEISRFAPVEAGADPTAFIAAPTLDRGTMLGVVILQLSADPIYALLNEYSGLGETGEIVAVSRRGARAAFVNPTRHDPDAAFVREVELGGAVMKPLQDAVLGGQSYDLMRDLRGVDTVAISRYLPSMRWGLVVKQDESEALALVFQERTIAIITSAVTTVLVLLVTFLVARSISRPISRLTGLVQRIAEGDLDQQIVPTTHDELAVLGHWFNTMTSELRKTYSTIEDKVRVRTRELEDANAALRRARNAAEAANRAKSSFLANMSHELRTPLNAVLGYAELLIEDARDDGDAQRATDLERIAQAGQHLLALISDVLDLSKIEAGRQELVIEDVDVQALVDSAVTSVRPRIDKNHNQLQVEFGDDLGTAKVDARKLRQILINLVGNAAKFTENGTIRVVVAREGDDQLSFAISDTGIGIPESKFAHLFQAFEQLDTSTTRRYGGTGLGLALSQRLAMLMGGRISVRSEVGRGSTFTLQLPAQVMASAPGLPASLSPPPDAVPAPTSDAVPEPTSIDGADVQIVVVDDGSDARQLLRRILESAGYSVVCTGDGEAGVRLARQHKPEVVLLDIKMPGVDGWATLAALKSDARTADIPVIIVSIVDDKERGFVLGASEYLLKPLERSKLLSAVRRFAHDPSQSNSILVVEDDEAIRDATSRILRSEGWQVREAKDGQEALRQVAAEEPGLILLDLMMPELDGFGFLERLRQEPRYAHLPIIVLTAKDLTEEDVDRLRAGLTRYYQKSSLNHAALIDEIRSCISRRRQPTLGEGQLPAIH
ncbi:response regulator [Haliangium sp.]|uniref:response regulator n=1 Tax=Haliangium sp. TaxID=2663208 RepID=UPI003D11A4E3